MNTIDRGETKMGNETKINPFAIILNAVTKVNPNLASQKEETASQTVVNSELAQAHEIEAQVQEQLLLGKYSVVKPLDVVSGEADLYLCNYQEKSYVAKIYRRDVAIKSEVMQALKDAQCMDIIEKFPDGVHTMIGSKGIYVSGGESQRVKLATELAKKDTGKTLYVLDEPTTGLHFEDIRVLLGVLNKLVDKGNTIIVIEHNLDVIKCADYLIDMGPEGGRNGGQVLFTGTPEEMVKVKTKSYTAPFLKDELKSDKK